eukprot:TRINITY_DN11698_c0_g1_i1.p1 TRINITY_DN11698_c0_g1~~TRINITY_DN11698_c0_g1_i1.p1  ORF type:complete len:351 (+),score=24.40 TRINITY_DN11698_c0_g1_i1:716-1768(+)
MIRGRSISDGIIKGRPRAPGTTKTSFNKAEILSEISYRNPAHIVNEVENDVRKLISRMYHSRGSSQGNVNKICNYISNLSSSGVDPGLFLSKQILLVLNRCGFTDEVELLIRNHLLLLFNKTHLNSVHYAILMAVERKRGLPERCEQILSELREAHLPTGTWHYAEAIGAYAHFKMESKAFFLFNQMRNRGISPNSAVCMQLLHSCRTLPKAFKVIKIMESLGLDSRRLDIYVKLAYIAISNKQFHLPLRFISAAIADGHEINKYALQAIAKYYLESGQPSKVVRMFPAFTNPGIVAYSFMETACLRLKKSDGDLYHQILEEIATFKKGRNSEDEELHFDLEERVLDTMS